MTIELEQRLKVPMDAGLIPTLPTSWQIHQGTLEMTPFVSSADATAERHYVGARFGHSLVRQPLIASNVGLDHFRTGTALGAKLDSLRKHLHFTYHEGMPVFDLQVVQTHPGGLDYLRSKTEEALANRTLAAKSQNKFVALFLPRSEQYYAQFVGEQGWIQRAERLDYPSPDAEGSAFPDEFFSLVSFINYCASEFPAHPRDTPWHRYPTHIANLVGLASEHVRSINAGTPIGHRLLAIAKSKS
ncbi:MAG: hypothetical protein GY811_21935 [Myxococcales bacterium]|nr:hypothetical protein [Myxococcales bacterium]